MRQSTVQLWRRRSTVTVPPSILNAIQPSASYGRIGNLAVRLACSTDDIHRAQRLRYQVFYNEMSAVPDPAARSVGRDIDTYDALCDHLLVEDVRSAPFTPTHWRRRAQPVVGTYRILRQDLAEQHRGFYSQREYDVATLINSRGPDCRFLELGRSCVLRPYRNKRTVELLWHGLWRYMRDHGISAVFGCASFEGTDPQALAEALSFLHHHAAAPPEWSVRAHDHLRVDMNMRPAEAVNPRTALRTLPPLIKGYLKLGCVVGDGAVVDHQFGTTDVLMILPVERIATRYFAHFGQPSDMGSRLKEPR